MVRKGRIFVLAQGEKPPTLNNFDELTDVCRGIFQKEAGRGGKISVIAR